jgi:hypothetical protein
MTENKNRTDFIIASDIAKKDNFELVWDIEEYNDKFVSVKIPIPVICSKCKTNAFKSLFNMKRGSKCKICGEPKKTKLLKYKKVNEEFTKNGMKLIWTEKEFNEKFTGCTQKIPVICVCNGIKELYYSNVRKGRKCQDCANNRKKTYEEVLKIINDNGMKLLYTKEEFNEIYKSMNAPIKVLCKCNRDYIVRVNDIKFGYSCKECGKDKSKNTMLNNHGCEYALQSEEIKNKVKATNLERYGVEYISQSEEIKDKIKATNLERYGVENVLQSEEIKDKIKATNLERYGVEYISQSEEIKNKIKATNLERYGVENVFQSEEIKNKIKATNLERYGVENVFQSEEIKDKIKDTNLEIYGCENAVRSNVILEKIKETNLKKFGVEYPFQSNVIQQKVKTSVMNKYGVEFIIQVPEIKEKVKKTNLKKFGVEYPAQNEEIRKKMQQTNIERHGVPFALQNEEIFKKSVSKMKSFKLYKFPSGNTIEIQGYEHFALDELLKNGILEEDIITGSENVPEIWYIDSDYKKHRHYVDIYIMSQNKCIEVKSEWTLKLQEHIMVYKQIGAEIQGYNYEIWIYDHKGTKIENATIL